MSDAAVGQPESLDDILLASLAALAAAGKVEEACRLAGVSCSGFQVEPASAKASIGSWNAVRRST